MYYDLYYATKLNQSFSENIFFANKTILLSLLQTKIYRSMLWKQYQWMHFDALDKPQCQVLVKIRGILFGAKRHDVPQSSVCDFSFRFFRLQFQIFSTSVSAFSTSVSAFFDLSFRFLQLLFLFFSTSVSGIRQRELPTLATSVVDCRSISCCLCFCQKHIIHEVSCQLFFLSVANFFFY